MFFCRILNLGDNMEIECVLKELITDKGIKQKFIAEKAGISPGTLSFIIRGKTLPTLSVAYKIAEVLEMRVEDIWVKRKALLE